MSEGGLLEVWPMQEPEMSKVIFEERCNSGCKEAVQEEVVEEGSEGQGQTSSSN